MVTDEETYAPLVAGTHTSRSARSHGGVAVAAGKIGCCITEESATCRTDGGESQRWMDVEQHERKQ